MTTAKKTYWEKLQDPRWQKKRLKILHRANFTCERCGDKTSTLHVHHGYYEKGLDPWEYEDKTLRCLCEYCHEEAQDEMRDIHKKLAVLGTQEVDLILSFFDDIKLAESMFAAEQTDFATFESLLASLWLHRIMSSDDPASGASTLREIMAKYERLAIEGSTSCTLGTSNSIAGSSTPK